MTVPRLSTIGLISLPVLFAAAVIPFSLFRLEPTTSLGPAEVKDVVSWLRSGLSDGRETPLPESLSRFSGDRVPLVLTVWHKGFRHKVFQSDDTGFADGLRKLAAGLKTLGTERSDPTLRLQLDAGVAVGPVSAWPVAESVSFAEGHDGIIGEVLGKKVLVPPSELVRRNV
ncbi:MAG: hypothetical protein HY897_02470 [Deltaproteobacteria bacterium]|nr:hypothetical protein [Deltaproteobacteria bacterium]